MPHPTQKVFSDVLDTCTEAQRRRFLLYALDGLSLAEIGVLCGCSKVPFPQAFQCRRIRGLNLFSPAIRQIDDTCLINLSCEKS